MFKPLAMQQVELSLLKDDAAQAALLLANYGAFDPETLEIAADQLPEAPGEAYRQAYTQCRAHLDKILAHFEISAPDTVSAPMQPVGLLQLTETGSWLKTLWGKCSEDQERMRRLREELRHAAQLLGALRAENSHQPFRRRERAMQRFRSMKTGRSTSRDARPH